jgi:hypothetical protein
MCVVKRGGQQAAKRRLHAKDHWLACAGSVKMMMMVVVVMVMMRRRTLKITGGTNKHTSKSVGGEDAGAPATRKWCQLRGCKARA